LGDIPGSYGEIKIMLIKSFYDPESSMCYHLETEKVGDVNVYTISVLHNGKMIIIGQYKVDRKDVEDNHYSEADIVESFIEVFNEHKEEKKKLQDAMDKVDDVIDIGDC